MKLVHPDCKYQMEFTENKAQIMIIENPRLFYEYIQDLYVQCNDAMEGKFVLSEGDKILALSKKAFICINPFELDINQKRILSKLYTELKEKVYEDELYIRTTEVISAIEKYKAILMDAVDYNLECEENLDIMAVFKLMNIKLVTEYESILEKIIDVINVFHELCDIEVFIFVNLKSYLSEGEIEQLYKMMEYKKYNLLLIESRQSEKQLQNEQLYIIDKDACEIGE